MSTASSEQLELLLALQMTDSRVRKLDHQRDDLPEQRQLDETLAQDQQLEREHDENQVELDRARARLRQLEREVDVLTQRRDAEQVRLYDGTVANAREMKAIEAEIETTQRRIAEHEDQLLEALEQVDELETQATELTEGRRALAVRTEELTRARDEAAKEIIAEKAELEVIRDRQVSELPNDLLQRYQQAADRPGGTGVGKLVGNACSACRIEMSMADVSELYAGPPLTTCPQCRRLLVVPA